MSRPPQGAQSVTLSPSEALGAYGVTGVQWGTNRTPRGVDVTAIPGGTEWDLGASGAAGAYGALSAIRAVSTNGAGGAQWGIGCQRSIGRQ